MRPDVTTKGTTQTNDAGNLERYPGIRPFGKNQALLFYGRTTELNELLNSIKAYNLFVLHSKSGLGKTSLLNAGLIPMLQKEGYIPIEIRFRFTNIAKDDSFEAVDPIEAIEEACKPFINQTALSTLEKKYKTLWVYLKLLTAPQHIPVLIFDQFEEFFSHPDKARKDQIILQIAELLNDRPPNYMYDFVQDHTAITGEDESFFLTPPQLHILFSIRSDKLALLDEMKPLIPSITNKRFQLNPLYATQARQAIMLPASLINYGEHSFAKSPFVYDDKALDTILKVLQDKPNATEIESTQLQIICESIEKKLPPAKKGLYKEVVITEDFFDGEEGLRSILKNFYNNQIAMLAGMPNITTYDIGRVRDMIETRMILDEMRVGLLEKQVINFLKDVETLEDEQSRAEKAKDIIKELVDLRIIRSEDTYLGLTYVITHDTLIRPIQESHKQIQDQREKDAAKSFEYVLTTIDNYTGVDPFDILDFFATKMIVNGVPKPMTESDILQNLASLHKPLDHSLAKRLIAFGARTNFLKPGKTGAQIQYQIADQFMTDLVVKEHATRKAIRDYDRVQKEKLYLEELEKKNKTRGRLIGAILMVLFLGAAAFGIYSGIQTKKNERILARNLNYEAERSYSEGNTVLAYALWRQALQYAPGDSVISAHLANKRWVPYTGSNVQVSEDMQYVATLNINNKLSIWKDGDKSTDLIFEKANVYQYRFFREQPIIYILDDAGRALFLNLTSGDTLHFENDFINLDTASLRKGAFPVRINSSGRIIMVNAPNKVLGFPVSFTYFWDISGRYLENISTAFNEITDTSGGYQWTMYEDILVLNSEAKLYVLSFNNDKVINLGKPDNGAFFEERTVKLNDSLYLITQQESASGNRKFMIYDLAKEKIVYKSSAYHDNIILSDRELATWFNHLVRVYNFTDSSSFFVRLPNDKSILCYGKLGTKELLIGSSNRSRNLASIPIADTVIYRPKLIASNFDKLSIIKDNYVVYNTTDSISRLLIYDHSKPPRKELRIGIDDFEVSKNVVIAYHGDSVTIIQIPTGSQTHFSFRDIVRDSLPISKSSISTRFKIQYPKFVFNKEDENTDLLYLDPKKNDIEHLADRYKSYIDKKLSFLGINRK